MEQSAAAIAVSASAWSPLRLRLFRALWIASVVSNIGTIMHDVGAVWLMTSLTQNSPGMVGLLQAASSLPIFLLALPSGAIADVFDARLVLIAAQWWMLAIAAALGGLAYVGLVTPAVLLSFTALLGLGAALNMPSWQAIIPALVGPEELPGAIVLGSVSYNIARAVGPALGGLVVARWGSWAVFVLNAVSFVGVVLVLHAWRRPARHTTLPAQRLMSAIRSGLRYAQHAQPLRAVLVRTCAFMISGSALWALVPVASRTIYGQTAFQYGILLGFMGAGAVLAAPLLAQLRRHFSADALVAAGSLGFALVLYLLGASRGFPFLCVWMAVAGAMWVVTLSTLSVCVQTAVPGWVRARALAMHLLVFMAGYGIGGALWGALAGRFGVEDAFTAAAITIVAILPVVARHRLAITQGLDLRPSLHWFEPTVAVEPHPEEGPVLVTVTYRVSPANMHAMVDALHDLALVRRRDGAAYWGLFVDAADPGRLLETFLVESWAEHLRQHERATMEDAGLEGRVLALHEGDGPPQVSHLIAARRGAPGSSTLAAKDTAAQDPIQPSETGPS